MVQLGKNPTGKKGVAHRGGCMPVCVILDLAQSPHLGILLNRWQSGILWKTRQYVKVGIRVEHVFKSCGIRPKIKKDGIKLTYRVKRLGHQKETKCQVRRMLLSLLHGT